LPQWSSREQSAARYEVDGACLHLLIEEEQQPWCPELDGVTRVSSLQTGVFAGPLGSTVGQHRFNPDAVVREEQDDARLFTPQYGIFALRARAVADADAMVALWMIGYEDRPERSAEICVCEIFGRDVARDGVSVGMGVHPFGDPDIVDDFEQVRLPIDATELHEYAAEWTPDRVTFFVDGRPCKTVRQSPQYPMQFMLGIYAFADRDGSRGPHPKRFTVDRFRAYRPVHTAEATRLAAE
jgi:Glycosyl hydrolases family 16